MGPLVQGEDFERSGHLRVVLCVGNDRESAGIIGRTNSEGLLYVRPSADGSAGVAGNIDGAGIPAIGTIHVWQGSVCSFVHG